MDYRFLCLEGRETGSKKKAPKRAGSQGKNRSSKGASTRSPKSTGKNKNNNFINSKNSKTVKSNDFFTFLSNLLKLRIFYMSKKVKYDFYKYN